MKKADKRYESRVSNDEDFIIHSDILLLYTNHALKIQVNKFNTKKTKLICLLQQIDQSQKIPKYGF